MLSDNGIVRTDSILDRIVADARGPLERAKVEAPEPSLLGVQPPGPVAGLGDAVRRQAAASRMGLVAEIKRASPSRGVLAPRLDPRAVARSYARAGAAGISVVTERNHFLGELDWLRDVRRLLDDEWGPGRPSLLRKDFVFDPYQVVEARAYGADAVLLIVAMLEDALLRDLLACAAGLGLDALVEVHTEAEAERAVAAGAALFGINNRDLHTFQVDLGTTERIRPLLPAEATVIGESGVHTPADVERLRRAGVHAILVGEAFMTAADVEAKIAELLAAPGKGIRA